MANEAVDGRNLEQYIPSVLGPFTHRKISEKDTRPIDFPNARAATQEMRVRLGQTFQNVSEVSFQSIHWDSPALIKASYRDSLTSTPEGNSIDRSTVFEDYLRVNTNNHATALKELIISRYDPFSIPRTYINLLDQYEQSLGVSGQEAAVMTLRFLTEYLPLLNTLTQTEGGIHSDVETGKMAFRSLEGLMDSHIEEVRAIQKAMKINASKAQALALRSVVSTGDAPSRVNKITLSKNDQEGLVEAIHIQDRPYSKDELELAARMLAENKYLGTSFIAFQQLLIQHSWDYFIAHPERLSQNLEPFNPIFIPIKDDNGTTTSFSPNPKLLKTICNNWLPSIAREVISENQDVPINEIDTNNLAVGQISNGIAKTDQYYIFTSNLGQFVATDDPQKVELRGSFSQNCPAKNVFIDSGKMILPDVYVYLKRLNIE